MLKKRETLEKNPKFSIVVPIKNIDRYLQQTLNSIFKQTYQNFEVIIQDGGSTDMTLAIVRRFAKRYPKKIKWESKRDKGQTDAVNKGFKKAIGDIFLYINGDDLLYPQALELVAESYRQNPTRHWFCGYGDIINEEGKLISNWVGQYKSILIDINSRFFLLCLNYLTQPATYITKSAFRRYGPFKGIGKIIIEYDLWLKLSKVEMPVIIKEPLASFRLTADSFSSNAFKMILKVDQDLVIKETKNPLIRSIHWLNNFGRIVLISVQKKYG